MPTDHPRDDNESVPPSNAEPSRSSFDLESIDDRSLDGKDHRIVVHTTEPLPIYGEHVPTPAATAATPWHRKPENRRPIAIGVIVFIIVVTLASVLGSVLGSVRP